MIYSSRMESLWSWSWEPFLCQSTNWANNAHHN